MIKREYFRIAIRNSNSHTKIVWLCKLEFARVIRAFIPVINGTGIALD